MKKESAATKRAKERGYFDRGPEWYCEFTYEKVKGLESEEGIHRRDPTSVILVDGTYYTWYTKSYGAHVGFGTGDLEAKTFPWDQSEIWYASSPDGEVWKEEGLALAPSEREAYDDRSVFTPEILAWDGKFYLVYQCVQHPYLRRTKNTIGMAVAESPAGPWRKLDAPLLKASDTGKWKGDSDNRFLVEEKGDFDSQKVHDPVLFPFKGKFYLYYKGERMGEEMYMGGRETKWGVAIADSIEGPYVKSEYNPVSNSGHETLLWPYKDGMAALLCTDGMERNTMQYAEDGINFEIMGAVKTTPEAAGPFRSGEKDTPLAGLEWGLCHDVSTPWNHIIKFRRDESLKEYFVSKDTYE
ncbi:MAG: family 43 glycosylhydrolase [Spirochaetales bacterium]|nr:family 43 glycosylhydrolase [Spirochaetales bacterium]